MILPLNQGLVHMFANMYPNKGNTILVGIGKLWRLMEKKKDDTQDYA